MDGIVYADIGPSSFNRQSHQHHNIIPALDADPIEYAQIKHNMKTSSIAEKVQPSLRADISGILVFGIWLMQSFSMLCFFFRNQV